MRVILQTGSSLTTLGCVRCLREGCRLSYHHRIRVLREGFGSNELLLVWGCLKARQRALMLLGAGSKSQPVPCSFFLWPATSHGRCTGLLSNILIAEWKNRMYR